MSYGLAAIAMGLGDGMMQAGEELKRSYRARMEADLKAATKGGGGSGGGSGGGAQLRESDRKRIGEYYEAEFGLSVDDNAPSRLEFDSRVEQIKAQNPDMSATQLASAAIASFSEETPERSESRGGGFLSMLGLGGDDAPPRRGMAAEAAEAPEPKTEAKTAPTSRRAGRKPVDISAIPPAAIAELKSDPSAQARKEFDQTFGAGAAAAALRQK